MEIEEQNSINFLDITVSHDKHTLSTCLYKKETGGDGILNFHSGHPFHTKLNTATQFLNRIIQLNTNKKEIHLQKQKLRVTLQKLHYPERVIKKIFASQKEKEKNEQVKNNNKKEPTRYIPFNFDPKIKEPIEKLIDHSHTKIAWGNKNKLISIYKTRRFPHNNHNRKNVVYLIPCSCKKFYIGESRRPLKIRINEHKKYVQNLLPTSHIVQHLQQYQTHKILWDDTFVLYEEAIHVERKHVEAMFINLNFDNCFSELSQQINREFNWLTQKFKKIKTYRNISYFYLT